MSGTTNAHMQTSSCYRHALQLYASQQAPETRSLQWQPASQNLHGCRQIKPASSSKQWQAVVAAHLSDALLGLRVALARPAAPAAQHTLSRVACSEVQLAACSECSQVGAFWCTSSPAADAGGWQHIVNLTAAGQGKGKRATRSRYRRRQQVQTAHMCLSRHHCCAWPRVASAEGQKKCGCCATPGRENQHGNKG